MISISQVQVESCVVVVMLENESTSAEVVAVVDEIVSLIRDDNGVERVVVRVEGEVPAPLRFVVRLLDPKARERDGKHVDALQQRIFRAPSRA